MKKQNEPQKKKHHTPDDLRVKAVQGLNDFCLKLLMWAAPWLVILLLVVLAECEFSPAERVIYPSVPLPQLREV